MIENEISSDSNIIPYSQYLLETQNAVVQDTNSSAQQDAMILSVFEQLSNQVTNCNKVNKDNLIANESLSTELERYKERVKLLEERQNMDLITREKLIMDDINREKNAHFADFEKEINSLKQTLSEQLKERDYFGKHFIPQQELSDEQAFWLQTSYPNIDQSTSSPVKIKAPRELLKEKVFVITALKNDLRKLKGKDIVDNAAQVSNATTIATRIASYSACKYVKLIQELLGYVRDTCPDIHKPSEKLVAVTPINKKKIVSEFQIKITATNKVPFREPIPLEVGAQESVVTKVYTRRPKVPKTSGSNSKSKISKYMISNKMDHAFDWEAIDYKLTNFVHKFLGTIKFGNDQIVKIMGYGDYQKWNITISRVYYIEGLGHNLFSVGQFCDSDLEVDFRKHTCFDQNLEGVDLLSGSRGTNLYSLSIGDMMASSPICLLSKATKTKSWLWHRRLSHLNFGAINHLARHGLVRGLPRLKFEKDHLCSACAMGKIKKQSHKPKSKDTNQEKLYLLHMDLCGPMRVASVNVKKYILVIVDDYSRFTWVKFLTSKDEALDFIIKFLKMIQVRLNATVRNIRTDNRTEFVNQTLRDYNEQIGISHETSVARTPQQNGVVERRNRTLIEVARTMNKKDERGIVIKNKVRLVAQGYTQEEGIDYDKVFPQVARIEAIRLFLAYASFKDFVVYQMDVKSAFLYGNIEEEVYVCQPPGFEDPEFPDKVYKVEK
ncbi:retrovirus-related pol polyprotein from transposon TNT 1-94, partial [Tanacetum coccineum]